MLAPPTISSKRLAGWTRDGAARFDERLESLISERAASRPPRLVAAMKHAALAGGKRLRPYLALESGRLLGIDGAGPVNVAAALECVHCYSLVHDDLPSMDNDDMRRGQPTVHRAYDEATAILAGDALLTLAFAILTRPETAASANVRARLVRALAEASGIDGMVGGQMLDLDAEGRFNPGAGPRALDADAIASLQGLKTGALIRFGATAGALLQPRLDRRVLRALDSFGDNLGLAFQIRDDLIDIEGDAATAGKAIGKDSAAGKGTFVTLLGLDGARSRLDAATCAGFAALDVFGAAADPLREVLAFNRTRLS